MDRFRFGHRCTNEECTFWIPREIRQKVMTEKIIRELVENKETGIIQGFHKRGTSQTFAAKLYIDEKWKIRFDLGEETDFVCPKCRAMLQRFERGYKCVDRKKCGFVLWDRFGGKQLTDEQMKMLLTEKRTELIKGFISKKSGKTYSARIIMRDGGDLGVEFDQRGHEDKN